MARVEAIEQWLDSHGATYDLRTIKSEQVDRAASHRNQARIAEPVNEETAVLYGAAMEQGDLFPPIVVSLGRDGKAVVIDGNHRVAGYDLTGAKSFEAYVLSNLTDAQRSVLTFEANTKHGLPTSLQERLRQAIHLVELGTTHKEAARMLGLPLARVANAVNRNDVDRRLQSLGVERWDRLPATARARLYAIRSDKVLKAIVDLAVSTKMPGTEIDKLVVRVNAASRGDDEKQMAVVEAEKSTKVEEIKATAGGRVGWSRQALALNSILSRTVRLDPYAIGHDSIGEDMRKRLQVRTIEAMNRLSKVAEALATPKSVK